MIGDGAWCTDCVEDQIADDARLRSPGAHGRRSCRCWRRIRVAAGRLRQARQHHGRRGSGRLPHQPSDRHRREGAGARPAGRRRRSRHDASRSASSLEGFLDGYDRSAAPVRDASSVPVGSAQRGRRGATPPAISRSSARATACRESRIIDDAPTRRRRVDVSAPVRVSYTAMAAQTNKCGRWPEDLLGQRREQALRRFRLLLSEQPRRADRQSGRSARAAQA